MFVGPDSGYESTGTSTARTDRLEIAKSGERLGVSPEQLTILSIEEKLAQIEEVTGHSAQQQLLLVNFKATDDEVRLFSARKASRRERKDYEENIGS